MTRISFLQELCVLIQLLVFLSVYVICYLAHSVQCLKLPCCCVAVIQQVDKSYLDEISELQTTRTDLDLEVDQLQKQREEDLAKLLRGMYTSH